MYWIRPGAAWGKRLAAVLLALAVALPPQAAKAAQQPPTPQARGYALIEAATGRVLAGGNLHERLPMASTTKIMTALLALEQPEPDRWFLVNRDAIQVEGSSMGLQPGDQVTLRVLAAGMLLHSGNDGAGAAAVAVSGSQEAFVEEMNRRAAEMGLLDTHFSTPSGLDADGHYSSAYDMAQLARQALRNPDFAEICASARMQVRYGAPPYERWLVNHNRLLEQYSGATGVKTGFTKKAGRCLVSSAQRDGVTLICVTLGAPDDWNDHTALLDYGFGQIEPRNLRRLAGERLIPVAGGTSLTAAAGPAGSLWAGLLPGDQVEARIFLRPLLFAPAPQGQAVGEARFFLDGQEIGALPMCLREDVLPVRPGKKRAGTDGSKNFGVPFGKAGRGGRSLPTNRRDCGRTAAEWSFQYGRESNQRFWHPDPKGDLRRGGRLAPEGGRADRPGAGHRQWPQGHDRAKGEPPAGYDRRGRSQDRPQREDPKDLCGA